MKAKDQAEDLLDQPERKVQQPALAATNAPDVQVYSLKNDRVLFRRAVVDCVVNCQGVLRARRIQRIDEVIDFVVHLAEGEHRSDGYPITERGQREIPIDARGASGSCPNANAEQASDDSPDHLG